MAADPVRDRARGKASAAASSVANTAKDITKEKGKPLNPHTPSEILHIEC